MLLELRVRDVGIIDEINWRLDTGLNVITGETGAGKSLVIDAVEALLGAKPDEETVRHGADAAHIEGVFAINEGGNSPLLRDFLVERGISSDEDTLVIKCELRRKGRSLIRVNGHAVTRGVLQQIGRLLIDVHGQSEHLSLLDKRRHLDFLDLYAHTTDLRSNFSEKTAAFHQAETELERLSENARETVRQEEFLRFQADEIDRAELREGEDDELEQERNILASTEKLKSISYEAYRKLRGEDSPGPSAIDSLSEAVSAMKGLAELDPGMKEQLESLETNLFSLEDLARDIRNYGERLEYDPTRLEEIEMRLELIRSLKRKYGQSIVEILAFREKAATDLEGISHSSERRVELEEKLTGLKQELGTLGSELSLARTTTTGKLKVEVQKELQDLDMPVVEFDVRIEQQPDENGIPFPDGDRYTFDNTGADSVELFVSTNPGEPPKPLARIASTGEMSRFMLALKGVLSEADDIPVLVFDEIDIGIGGRSGEVVGRKLSRLARSHQVICITHLPQIAAYADSHHHVHKEVSGGHTLSRLETLGSDARLAELAAMLSGPDYTQTSLESAKELVVRAETWKGQ
ncbi:MAG TPA: DNA repair protein RecN [Dehalococcoidia bacterium]|nr:DNA repair protein RecN [Dehalococcoidia bacterium]